jgi:hypothetical protein
LSLNKVIDKSSNRDNNSLSVEKIYNDSLNKSITKATASEMLITLVEESHDDIIRIKSIDFLGKLCLKDKKIFKILENVLISDENPLIRSVALEFLFKSYPNECYKTIKWMIENDHSSTVLRTIALLLKNNPDNTFQSLRDQLKNKLLHIYGIDPEEVIFLLDLEREVGFFNVQYFRMYSSNNIHGVISSKNYMMCTIKKGHIRALNLSNWRLNRIPESIFLLSKLRYLILRNNNIKKLPKSIGLLHNLKTLDLQDCDLHSIPASIIGLKKLKNLTLNLNNTVKVIPESIILIAKTNFRKKYILEGVVPDEAYILGLFEILTGMKLKKIKTDYSIIYSGNTCGYKLNKDGHIVGIYIFNSKFSYLKTIPDQVCSLKFLEELDLPNNDIRYIPNSITRLTNLKIFNLRNNKIKEIPDDLKDLNLVSLKLAGNQIKHPPEWIKSKLDKFESIEDLNRIKRDLVAISFHEIIRKITI